MFDYSRFARQSALAAMLVTMPACGTFLAVKGTDIATTTKTDGVVVNSRRPYEVRVDIVDSSLQSAFAQSAGASERRFVGVDHARGLILDVSRMPFASGGLEVKLSDQQVVKEVKLTSETGAARFADAAKSSLETAASVETTLATTTTTLAP